MSADKFITISNISFRKSCVSKIRIHKENIIISYVEPHIEDDFIEYPSQMNAKNDYSRILRELSED